MMEHAVTRSLQTSHDSCNSFWCHNVVAVSLLCLTWCGYPCTKLSETVIYSELAYPSGFHADEVLRHRCTVVLIAGRALLLLLKAVHRVEPLGTRGTNPRWYFASARLYFAAVALRLLGLLMTEESRQGTC